MSPDLLLVRALKVLAFRDHLKASQDRYERLLYSAWLEAGVDFRMRAIEQFLGQVREQIKKVDEAKAGPRHALTYSLHRLRDKRAATSGHCATCGLSKDKHAAHDPPDVAKPEDNATAEEREAYYAAVRVHYRVTLQTLSDGEILQMAIPISSLRLKVLEEDVARRCVPKPTRYTRLGSDDEEFDE